MAFAALRKLAAVPILVWAAATAGPAHAQLKKFAVQGGAPVPYIAFAPIYIGQQAGFFKEDGLDVEIRYSSGAPQATQLAAAGQADVAMITVEPSINGYEKGIRGKIIFATNNHLIYFIAVPESSPIQRIEELKGKKIGVSNFGSAAVPVVRAILRAAGIEPGADTLVPVGVMDQAMAALQSNNVQALGLFDGIYFGLERAGYKFRYFKHPTLATLGNGGMFASDKAIATRRDDICGFGRGFAKSVVFMLTNPEAATRMWWNVSPAARRGATDEEAMKNGLPEIVSTATTYDLGFPPQKRYGVIDQARFKSYVDLLKQEGVIASVPPVGELVTDSFIDCINKFDAEQVRKVARGWKG
ncbi:MAG TPA: ABC transporter substrate-binding protein [Vineibacter sp.]|nr:ABC transporter substrate-binding protein [Vineibacter sp.]